MTGQIRDVDRGVKALLARMKVNKTSLTVGVHADTGFRGVASILQIANWNHEGTKRIRARPFLKQWFDTNLEANAQLVLKLFQGVVAGKISSVGAALKIVGVRFVGGVQKEIVSGNFVPNAASTIARKGSSKPLVDTGILKSSIRYKTVGA